MATFEETMATLRKACKAGDVRTIAERTGYTTQSVRNTLKCKSALELTAAGEKIFVAACEVLKPRIEKAKVYEEAAAKFMEE